MSTWEDACDPVPARREDDGVLRADGAPPKAEKQKRALSAQHRARLSASVSKTFAAMSPEERSERARRGIDAQRRAAQEARIKAGKLKKAYSVPSFFIDADFDEAE